MAKGKVERERNPPGEGRNRYSDGSVVDGVTQTGGKTADIKQSTKHLSDDKTRFSNRDKKNT